jgi:hypothetical protein
MFPQVNGMAMRSVAGEPLAANSGSLAAMDRMSP